MKNQKSMLDKHATAYIEKIMETMNDIDQKLTFLIQYDIRDSFPLRPPSKEPFPDEKRILGDIRQWYFENDIGSFTVGTYIIADLARIDLEELLEDARVISVRKLSQRLWNDLVKIS